MLETLFWIGVGVVLGWFFLDQPTWARDLIAKIPGVSKYMKK